MIVLRSRGLQLFLNISMHPPLEVPIGSEKAECKIQSSGSTMAEYKSLRSVYTDSSRYQLSHGLMNLNFITSLGVLLQILMCMNQ